jgi:pyruvate/2-oxoglutarate dehydrogenase complex dihydrolipoamide dehydrogenase (E3) component
MLGADVLRVEGRSGEGVRLRVRTTGLEQIIAGTDILVATGRIPNTAEIGLEMAGVELDARGYVKVNDRLETTAPEVWAIGECAGSPQFTHVSFDDFRIVRDNLAGGNRSTRDRLVPYCLFTDSPLARVGLSEGEARKRGIAVRVANLPISALLRTRTTGETTGSMKVLVEASGDRILGSTMIDPEAGEVMAALQTATAAARRRDDISTRAPTRRHAALRGDGGAREWPIVGARGATFAVIIEPWTMLETLRATPSA